MVHHQYSNKSTKPLSTEIRPFNKNLLNWKNKERVLLKRNMLHVFSSSETHNVLGTPVPLRSQNLSMENEFEIPPVEKIYIPVSLDAVIGTGVNMFRPLVSINSLIEEYCGASCCPQLATSPNFINKLPKTKSPGLRGPLNPHLKFHFGLMSWQQDDE